MEFKICTKCGEKKEINCFNKNGDYYRSECRKCSNEMTRKWRRNNKEKVKTYKREYYRKQVRENPTLVKEKIHERYERNKEIILERNKKWKEENREQYLELLKKYREKNADKIKEYRQKTKDKKRTYDRTYNKNKREIDNIYRLMVQTRNRINNCIRRKGYKKSSKTEEILGCDYETFMQYLLETYKNNYGIEFDNNEQVHIDHIVPLSTAKTEEDIIKLNHYTNLQLLKAKDNLIKHDKLDWRLNDDK